jgi:hypothetical protein
VFDYLNATVNYLPGTRGWGTTFGTLPTASWVPFTYYTNSDNATITITGYTGLGGTVIVPGTINGLPVTSIIDRLWPYSEYNYTSLTSVTIPGSVTYLDLYALSSCPILMGIYFQGNPPSLAQGAFSGDLLATVYYLPTPGTPGWGTTFSGLPTALWEPFTCATNSDNATVTITGYTGPGGTVTIPDTLNGLPVTCIGTNAFTSNAFYSALQITNVLIPNTVTNLGDAAFQMCSNLSGVYFQGNPPCLGMNVFTSDAMATAYYLPATTNWSTTLGILTTALWLTVNGGADGGAYPDLQQVTIIASNPIAPNGQLATFVQWLGPTQYVAVVGSASTTVNLPAQPITLTAMFNLPPIITTQPASQSVNNGGYGVFDVTAYGPQPLTYQWYFNDGVLTGATGTNYTLTGVTAMNAGNYTVVVSNPVGSATSSVAALTVLLPPLITTQPASQTVIHGSNVTFNVTVLGTPPLAYQWYFNGANLSGETTSSHSLLGVTLADAGDYLVVVTNLYGSVTSSLARLTHISLPPGFNQIGGLLLSAGNMQLSFVGIPGWNYALDRSFSLSPADWVPQATNPAGDGGALVFTNTPDPTTNNFWRIRLVR